MNDLRVRRGVATGSRLAAAVLGCGVLGGAAAAVGWSTPRSDSQPVFVDDTEAAGITFHHVNGAFGDKWMPETLGAGVAAFDADGDGWQDLLFVQGTVWQGHEQALPPQQRLATLKLFRNRHNGTFEDVTIGSGLDSQLYGFGAAPADYDNDGRADLYVTAYGPNRLFRNLGGGRFEDVTERAGVGHPGWGTSAAWLDYDRDADLDLYVANYVQWTPETDIWCTLDGTTKSYCNPASYTGEPSVLYRNEGSGRFVDVSRQAGIYVPGGKSLGITVADFNRDGWPDFVVANDTEPNFLFQNRKDGTFDEVGLLSGMALDDSGRARAGMGVDVADVRNNGKLIIGIGNFSNEMIGLFEPGPGGVFTDIAPRSQVGRTSLLALTFSLFFFEYDLDGWLDLLAINGHLDDSINRVQPRVSYAQRPLLYRNDPHRGFVEVGEQLGGVLGRPIVGRGAAYADLDRDGDLDLAVTTNAGPAFLWRNRARDTEAPPHLLRVRLSGTASNRSAVGAEVIAQAGDWRQIQIVRSGSSYASQSELALTFGLGQRTVVDRLQISWPSGQTTLLEGEALVGVLDEELVIEEGLGIIERLPLTGPTLAPSSEL